MSHLPKKIRISEKAKTVIRMREAGKFYAEIRNETGMDTGNISRTLANYAPHLMEQGFNRRGSSKSKFPTSEEFPAWLKKSRKVLRLSRKKLANKIFVTTTTIYNWEKGRTSPRDFERELAFENIKELLEIQSNKA